MQTENKRWGNTVSRRSLTLTVGYVHVKPLSMVG